MLSSVFKAHPLAEVTFLITVLLTSVLIRKIYILKPSQEGNEEKDALTSQVYGEKGSLWFVICQRD